MTTLWSCWTNRGPHSKQSQHLIKWNQLIGCLKKKTPSAQPSLLSTDVQNIVSTDERITVFVLQLSIDVFFSLFKSYVHESIQTWQNTTIINTTHQFDNNRSAMNLLNKLGERFFPTHGEIGVQVLIGLLILTER